MLVDMQVFERFLLGDTLEECYEAVAEVANRWLDMLDTQVTSTHFCVTRVHAACSVITSVLLIPETTVQSVCILGIQTVMMTCLGICRCIH